MSLTGLAPARDSYFGSCHHCPLPLYILNNNLQKALAQTFFERTTKPNDQLT